MPARIEAKDAQVFGRPDKLAGGDVPAPVAGVADPLRFGQGRLATPQFFLGPLPVGEVDRDPGEQRRASRDRDLEGADLRPDHTAIAAPVALLDAMRGGVTRGARRDDRLGGGTVVLMGDVGGRAVAEALPRNSRSFC